jgi:O-antigen ligase
MALYYLVGNQNILKVYKISLGNLTQIDPRLSWIFLFAFVALVWYRLPFAVALLPLTLPFYLAPKAVLSNVEFSPVEITLWLCVGIALVQGLIRWGRWEYKLSLNEIRDRVGPFLIPLCVFFLAALISITVALSLGAAVRTFREEVLDPFLFLGLALCCLRARQDITRLLTALFAIGFVIALLGIVQYLFFFKSTLTSPDPEGLLGIYTVYGSPNSVGLLFDYTLPIGLALVASRVSWRLRLAGLVCCLPFFFILSQDQSRGAALAAFPIALIFVLLLSVRNRKVVLIGSLLVLVLGAGVVGLYHQKIADYVNRDIINGHANQHGVSTLQRRIYLWESAVNMIHDSPWIGYGLDNWLCHYSDPKTLSPWQPKPGWTKTCAPAHRYYAITEVNGHTTYMNDEPSLSHPHNIFLHVWVSIGVFGLLAFVAVLILFFWLFARVLSYVTRHQFEGNEQLRWLTVGAGAGMLAAIIQGMGDSAFLEQDLSFCFWMLVTALLLIRVYLGIPWREMLPAGLLARKKIINETA